MGRAGPPVVADLPRALRSVLLELPPGQIKVSTKPGAHSTLVFGQLRLPSQRFVSLGSVDEVLWAYELTTGPRRPGPRRRFVDLRVALCAPREVVLGNAPGIHVESLGGPLVKSLDSVCASRAGSAPVRKSASRRTVWRGRSASCSVGMCGSGR
jgi:hypothetical protein